ncbi:hypothetical protein diail_8637 [Diaporthe ilicicola]|nr:hypothetical protein diail_8637 [Diaporthe ilicicola]
MKFSATLAALAAPLALAKAVHNVYPAKRDNELYPRKSDGKDKSQDGQAQAGGQALASMAGPGQSIQATQTQLLSLGLSGAGITTNAATEVVIIWVNQGAGAPTMNVNTPPMAAPAAAQTHQVVVGGAAGLVYTPSSITAAVGDMVVFTFMSANHTATQSAFATPCEALAGGMDSGFQPNANNSVNPPPQVAMQVMVDTPLWFYCKQKGHCGKGMTFSINPTATKTQAMFQSMAIAQNGTGAAAPITGGTGSAAPAAGAGAANSTGSGSGSAAGAAAGGSGSGSAASGSTTPTMGQGSVQGGACVCAVTCASGSFPAAQAQGLGAFGGLPGALPATMAEPMMNGAA